MTSCMMQNSHEIREFVWLYDWLRAAQRPSAIGVVRRIEGVQSDTTQLNSTRRRVELCRYKRGFMQLLQHRVITSEQNAFAQERFVSHWWWQSACRNWVWYKSIPESVSVEPIIASAVIVAVCHTSYFERCTQQIIGCVDDALFNAVPSVYIQTLSQNIALT